MNIKIKNIKVGVVSFENLPEMKVIDSKLLEWNIARKIGDENKLKNGLAIKDELIDIEEKLPNSSENGTILEQDEKREKSKEPSGADDLII